jgi:hypothetical protein
MSPDHTGAVPNDHVHRARDEPQLKFDKPISRAPVQQLLGMIICHRVLALEVPPTDQLAAHFCPYLFHRISVWIFASRFLTRNCG